MLHGARAGIARLLAVGAATAWAASGVAILQNPLSAPIVERSAQEIALATERAMARTVTPEWVETRLAEAIAEENLDRQRMILDIAFERDVPVPPALAMAAQEQMDAASGFLARSASCASCAWDIATCERLSQIAACAIPVELTPAGDLNALRRAGVAAASGEEVDRIEVGLALAGLGATGLVLASGGSSLTVKAGATAIRTARRMGALTPAFTRTLARLADVNPRWSRLPDYARGRIPLDQVVDAAKLQRLMRVGENIGEVRAATSMADTLVLLRHVETAEDAARLSRLAAARGPATLRTVEALGGARALRLTVRLSDLFWTTLALLVAVAMSILGWSLSLARRVLRPKPRGSLSEPLQLRGARA